MGVASKIIFYVLPIALLIVVVVIFFGESGQWEETKDIILGLKEVLPEVGVGMEELAADVSIPKEYTSNILNLNETIHKMLGKGKKNCFANYGGFSELGEKGTSIMLDGKEDKTILTVGGGAGGKQVITDLTLEFLGMSPCVIAGRGNVAEHFYKFFINGEKEKLLYPYYRPVSSLKIYYDTDNRDGNVIKVPEFGDASVNDESKNFESKGWLFTPDGRDICFFPTNWNKNYDDDGIANEWFTEGEENSIPNKIKRGELKLCS